MIKKPNVLFLNCLGSYFCSIVDSLDKENQGSVLCYLAGVHLEYKSLKLQDIKEKYHENPWGYQPIQLNDQYGNTISIDNDFFSYLQKEFNIEIIKDNRGLVDYLLIANYMNSFLICNVDEYYIPIDNQYYNNIHNKHFLLVRKYDKLLKKVEVIDSEKNKPYIIALNDFENAFYSNFFMNKLYLVNGQNYVNRIDMKCVRNRIEYLRNNNNWLYGLIGDIKIIIQNQNIEFGYYYTGYYYNILSKVIPFFKMIQYVLKKTKSINHDMVDDVLRELKYLCGYMRIMLNKNNCKIDSLVYKLNNIAMLLEQLYTVKH